MAERLEVAHDLLRGVGKGIHDAHKQARMERLYENFWQNFWSTWHHFNSFHKFRKTYQHCIRRQFCSLVESNDSPSQLRWMWHRAGYMEINLLFCQIFRVQCRPRIKVLCCRHWYQTWFVVDADLLVCLRFFLPDGRPAFLFWKRCVQAPLLYADEQSEQSWASAKIIALPQELSQKGKGGRWMEAVCVGCFQGQSADQYPQVCSRCVAPSAALKANLNSVEAIKVKVWNTVTPNQDVWERFLQNIDVLFQLAGPKGNKMPAVEFRKLQWWQQVFYAWRGLCELCQKTPRTTPFKQLKNETEL